MQTKLKVLCLPKNMMSMIRGCERSTSWRANSHLCLCSALLISFEIDCFQGSVTIYVNFLT